jgi:hypothetical protein
MEITMRLSQAAAVVVTVMLAATAAQAQDQPDQTGTGGGPLSTQRAPNTSTVGRTMPPSRDASPATTGAIERRTPQQRRNDEISKGICIGCN